MGFLRFRSRVSIHGSVGWVNSIEASGSKSCSCLRNSASLIRGVLQNGCRAGQRQYGSCSSAALPPTDLGKLRTVRSRRTSLFFQTGQPSSSRTISCEAVGASQPRTTLFQFRSQKDDRLGSRAENLTSSNLGRHYLRQPTSIMVARTSQSGQVPTFRHNSRRSPRKGPYWQRRNCSHATFGRLATAGLFASIIRRS